MEPAAELAPFMRRAWLPGLKLSVCYFDAALPQADQAAPPLLLVHGLQDESDTWRHVFLPLAEQRRVIALDLPGFGRSDKPRHRYSVPLLADALVELLDVLHIPAAALIGSSVGAMVAEWVALHQAGRVCALTLVGGTLHITRWPPRRPHPLVVLLLLPLLSRRYFAQLRCDPDLAYRTLRPYYARLEALPEADQQFLRRRVYARVWDEQQRRAAVQLERSLVWFLGVQAKRVLPRLRTLGIPTNIIWGEQDAFLPLENALNRAALQPSAKLHTIPASGHLPHQEHPAAFLGALRKGAMQSDQPGLVVSHRQ